jgi:heptosyltransferase-2
MFWRAHFARPAIAGATRKQPTSFLVVRLDSLGDVVMTTPLFRALKSAFPRSRCTVVVQNSYKSLLATNPHVDEILTLPGIDWAWLPQRLRRLVATLVFYGSHLRNRHFDFAISPRWDADEHLSTLLCVLSNAGTRVAYTEHASAAKQKMNRGFDGAFGLCLPPGPVQHEVLRNLAIAAAVGAPSCDGRLDIHITAHDRRRAGQLLEKVPPSARLVALGIGAQSPGRRWPLKRYAETIAKLNRVQRVCPVIVCSESEFGDALQLAELLPGPPVIVSGEQLRRVCAVLERCQLFIGNDSGCAHLAAAMGCHTLVLSRHPRSGDHNHFNSPVRFAPYGRQVRVLQPTTGLEGCRQACVMPKPHCILQISADQAFAAAHQLLIRPRKPAAALAPQLPELILQVISQRHIADGDRPPCLEARPHA